jgi:hypothetical protein
LGFRQATLCLGLALAWCVLRLRRAPASLGWAIATGLTLGLGWWASPEILYLVVPAVVVTVAGAVRATRRKTPLAWAGTPWPRNLLAGAAAAVVGALPWLYTNVGSGFASLHPSAAGVTGEPGYWSRVGTFFAHVLPTQVGAQSLFTGAWIGGPVVGVVILGVVLALVAWALTGAIRGVARATASNPGVVTAALAVVVFPFLFAFIPGTAYWADGRYGIYVGPLLVVFVFGATARTTGTGPGLHGGRESAPAIARRWQVPCTLALLGATVVTVAGAHTASAVPVTHPRAFVSGWHDPNADARDAVKELEAHHLDAAYGDYWTSYVLDVLSGGRVLVSPTSLDVVRDPGLARQVLQRHPAWLVFSPAAMGAASYDFSNPQPGPGPYDEASLETRLRTAGILFHVVHLGVLDAIVIPPFNAALHGGASLPGLGARG